MSLSKAYENIWKKKKTRRIPWYDENERLKTERYYSSLITDIVNLVISLTKASTINQNDAKDRIIWTISSAIIFIKFLYDCFSHSYHLAQALYTIFSTLQYRYYLVPCQCYDFLFLLLRLYRKELWKYRTENPTKLLPLLNDLFPVFRSFPSILFLYMYLYM